MLTMANAGMFFVHPVRFFVVLIGMCCVHVAFSNEIRVDSKDRPAFVRGHHNLPHREKVDHTAYQNGFPVRIGTTPPPPPLDLAFFKTTSTIPIPPIAASVTSTDDVAGGDEEEEEEDASSRKNQQKINDLMLDMLAASVGGKVVIEPWE
jgi:hypothetical protein